MGHVTHNTENSTDIHTNLTQEEKIFNYLKEGNSITPLEALEIFGCFRLGARIWSLKQKGYDIKCEIVRNKEKHFAKYYMPEYYQVGEAC
jgi:hypothetical protein